jgi:hypothetical protein
MFGYTSNEIIDEKTKIQFMDEMMSLWMKRTKKKMVMANGGCDVAIVACRAPRLLMPKEINRGRKRKDKKRERKKRR